MHVKPKKGLGQNFLFDKNIQRKLVASYNLKARDHVLEIGAGYGELTKLVADNAAFVYALEIDPELCKTLRDNTKGYSNIEIINQDILIFNLKRYFSKFKNKIKVVGNIPYYITTPIIGHLLKYRNKIETVFITVQKEFAKRIVANAGSKEYGSFSCFVQYYSIPKILFFIKKGSFSPIPKVDSCLLELKIRQVPAVNVKDEELFFKVIRASFNKRRKTLRNSLDSIVPLQKLPEFFKKYGIDVNIRPEDLTLKDFAHLANSI
jgi:16S rRNA (adenine1518-N6/adenine1519-N6)-dimethyltransferase